MRKKQQQMHSFTIPSCLGVFICIQRAATHIHSNRLTCIHNTDPHQQCFIKLGKQNINDSLEPALFISTQTKTDRACLMLSSQTYRDTNTLSTIMHFQTDIPVKQWKNHFSNKRTTPETKPHLTRLLTISMKSGAHCNLFWPIARLR